MNPWIVIKFGGSSVSSKNKWQQVLKIAQAHISDGFRVLIVHSAAQGMTNALENIVQGKSSQTDIIVDRLQKLAKELGINFDCIEAQIQRINFLSAEKSLNLYQQAELLSLGEIGTHQLAFNYLQGKVKISQLDPKTFLYSSKDDGRNQIAQILSAKCACDFNQDISDSLTDPLYIMPGYIASDQNGKTVVLGRGGSDTSAAYMSVILGAKKLQIWTDVHGIFSANPHTIPSARLLLKIDYLEAREIAASGGKVLHPRCILPVEQHQIPLQIKNTNDPELKGTLLSHKFTSTKPRVSAINTRHKITLVSMESINMWHQAGFLGDLFNIYKLLGLSVDLISTAQTNVTISLDNADNIIDNHILTELKNKLTKICQVKIISNCSAVTLVGYRIRALADKIAPVISTFSDQRIYISTQSSNDLNQTFVVDEDQADKLTRALHEALISEYFDSDYFGPSWQELANKKITKQNSTQPWWHTKKDQLLTLAQSKSPCHVYHLPTLQNQIDKLKSLSAIDQIYYACKANSHPEIIKLMHQNDIGLECVSPGEIQRVIASCPQQPPQQPAAKLLFTPNFAAKKEYSDAIAKQITITVDNPFILEHWPDIFAGKSIILRLDPGHGSGHHRYVRTAGEQSKFGIPATDLEKIKSICQKHNITIKGLHAHSGSGILNYQNWLGIINYFKSCLALFPQVTILNIGGGMGIRENPGDAGLNLKALNENLLSFKKQHPGLQIWIEPGRYLVAHSGVLLAKVTQTKWKNKQGYIGIETGMNSLIRPALYGSWHNIVNLSRLDEPSQFTANIVGPMCESGDVLGIDRKMPPTHAGDILLIANTGAYAASMASNYNLRKPASEIFTLC
ncbi:MAG: bifunctional aspartate kinase/diaminopimelate decarboxylase [Proteobacteria bacterium]|nr:bifunctional aspartate kinase/diaminopimelate decarboxylase [Pseudomonadota bacterium]